ncbi:MAG TPA: transglycosylase family protein [Thermoleophilaceae bacterium]|nr:transglycosylase family protein [Thermoleophilaceae bacterium]HEX5955050.1 transglycosylase family protein [Solirubrobacterales bacterium]
MARIFDAVRGAHLAAVLVLVAMVIAAVPALADPGATASGGASASSEVIVKRGDRGPAVRSIQQRLRITADGVFGPVTERAVKRFQSRHNLVPDGIVGPLTRSALGLRPFSTSSVRRTSVRLPAILRQIAECESGGNPRAISPGGTYRGKYQFSRETWRNLGGTGDPAAAPEWLQDRMALKLYRLRGTAPWPSCA